MRRRKEMPTVNEDILLAEMRQAFTLYSIHIIKSLILAMLTSL